MEWIALLRGSVAPAHTDLFDGLDIRFRPPFVFEIHNCPPPQNSDRADRLFYARWDLFQACIKFCPLVAEIVIYADECHRPLKVFSRSESLDLIRAKQMDFEYLMRQQDNSLILTQAKWLNSHELASWVRTHKVPTALVDNATGDRRMISYAYAEWCGGPWEMFMRESGQVNLSRWVQGETKRMLEKLERQEQGILAGFEYRARLWNDPDTSLIWQADVAEVEWGGRSHRLVIFRDRQADNLVSV